MGRSRKRRIENEDGEKEKEAELVCFWSTKKKKEIPMDLEEFKRGCSVGVEGAETRRTTKSHEDMKRTVEGLFDKMGRVAEGEEEQERVSRTWEAVFPLNTTSGYEDMLPLVQMVCVEWLFLRNKATYAVKFEAEKIYQDFISFEMGMLFSGGYRLRSNYEAIDFVARTKLTKMLGMSPVPRPVRAPSLDRVEAALLKANRQDENVMRAAMELATIKRMGKRRVERVLVEVRFKRMR